MGWFKELCKSERNGSEISREDQQWLQRVNSILIKATGSHLLQAGSIPRHLLTLLDERSSEAEVEKALAAIQSTPGYRRGFYRARESTERGNITQELDRRAETFGVPRLKAMKIAVKQNIYLASQELGDCSPYEVERQAKSRLNAAMSKDFFVEHVGSQKQKNERKHLAACYQDTLGSVNKNAELEARLTLFSLVEVAGLTSAEETVVLATLEGLEDEELAFSEDVSTAAIRKRRQRAFKKIRAVAN